MLEAGANIRSLLLRIDGGGAGALLGTEAGTHRWRGSGRWIRATRSSS